MTTIPTVELAPINDLKVDGENPNRMSQRQREALSTSINRYGFIIPIITNKDLLIADGEQRWEVAKERGMTEVPVVKLDVEDVDRRLLRQVLNKLKGQHQEELDAKEYMRILAAGERDSLQSLILISNRELERYLDLLNPSLDDPFPLRDTNIQLGQVFQLGTHRLMCGDSTDEGNVKQLYDSNHPILMVTDPPYGVDYDANWRNKAFEEGYIKYGARSVLYEEQSTRTDWTETFTLFSGNVSYVWHADRHAKDCQLALETCGFNIINQIVWVKQHFAVSRGNYHWQHEPCWYAVRQGTNRHWQGSRRETTVWSIPWIPSKDKTGHSTQKPLECMLRPILNNSEQGDIVYDPFIGSGTTIMAAEHSNRMCYAMEIDPRFVQMSIDRWEAYTGQTAELMKE